MAEPPTVGLEAVRAGEFESIADRRQCVILPAPTSGFDSNTSGDLVGLALSGGGLRSACFSLGFVQALLRSGLWRFVDYLSTVSGGGYIGAFLASYLVRTKKPFDRENCPLLPRHADRTAAGAGVPATPETSGQPPDVRRFIYGGRYLFRLWELLNKYLIGLFFMNAAIFSLIGLAAALAAFLWRCLDYDFVRDRLTLLGLRGDLMYALLPFLVCGALWFVAWVVSYFQRGAEAPGVYARVLLLLTGVALAIGVALLLGNGDIDLAVLTSTTKQFKLDQNRGVITTLIGLLLSALLPFLAPWRLIQSGLHPQRQWEQWLFGIASTAALVGLPMLFVGVLARENISGFNTNPYREVVPGDVDSVEALVNLLFPSDIDGDLLLPIAPARPETGAGQAGLSGQVVAAYHRWVTGRAEATETTNALQPSEAERVIRQYFLKLATHDPATTSELRSARDYLWDYRKRADLALNGSETSRADRYQDVLAELDTDHRGDSAPSARRRPWSGDPTTMRRLKLLILLSEVERDFNQRWVEYHALDRDVSIGGRLTHLGKQVVTTLTFYSGLYDAENDAAELLQVTQWRQDLLRRVTDIINDEVLFHSLLKRQEEDDDSNETRKQFRRAATLASVLRAARNSGVATAGKESRDTGAGSLSPVESARLKELVDQSLSQNVNQLTPDVLFEMNVLMLSEQYGSALRPRSAIRRLVSLERDQQTRAWIVGLALALFATVGVWVDANATSMHRFYRTRLAQAFVVPQKDKAASPALTELTSTTALGAPYFLINGACGLVIDRTGQECRPAGFVNPSEAMPYFRPVDTFLMSARYCGCDSLGYVPTEDYESWIRGDENHMCLAEATAISGAALSPGQVSNALLAFLMFSLNLRLGQWLPNPARGAPRWRPRVLALLVSQLMLPRNRAYCFVTDGGNNENLGLVTLLLRRCRLIVQVDAAQDPQHSFDDLARAIRLARVHHGIRLVSLDDPTQDCHADALQLRDAAGQPLEADKSGGNCNQHYFVARILYPASQGHPATIGTFIYLKPSFTGDESIDLRQYRAKSPDFPHETTSDQAYEPQQVEAYRQLGWHIGEDLCRALGIASDKDLWDDRTTTVAALCQRIESHWHGLARTAGSATDRERPASDHSDTDPAKPSSETANNPPAESRDSVGSPPLTPDCVSGPLGGEIRDRELQPAESSIPGTDRPSGSAGALSPDPGKALETAAQAPLDQFVPVDVQDPRAVALRLRLRAAKGAVRNTLRALKELESEYDNPQALPTSDLVGVLVDVLANTADKQVADLVLQLLEEFAEQLPLALVAIETMVEGHADRRIREAAKEKLAHIGRKRRKH